MTVLLLLAGEAPRMKTLQITAAVLAMLLMLSSASASRTLSALDNKVVITNGAVSEANMKAGVPAGRSCVATGMHCSSNSQCCSKGCNAVYYRCG